MAAWDLTGLPVPADAIVYTVQEFGQLSGQGRPLREELRDEAVWVYEAAATDLI